MERDCGVEDDDRGVDEMKLEELMRRHEAYLQEEVEQRLYETFCRFFDMSPMEMIMNYSLENAYRDEDGN